MRLTAAMTAAMYCSIAMLGCGQRQAEVQAIIPGTLVQHFTGLARYDASWTPDGTARLVLRGQQGESRGRLEVQKDRAVFTAPDGSSATYRSAVNTDDMGITHSFRKLEVGSDALEIQTLADHDGRVITMQYLTHDGQDALEVAHDNVFLPSASIQRWLEEEADIQGLVTSDTARTLLVAMQDRALMTGLMQTQGYTPRATAITSDDVCQPTTEGGSEYGSGSDPLPVAGAAPDSGTQRIHKSPLCGVILGALLGAAGGSVCAACVAAAAALPATAGISSILALPACIWCAVLVGAGVIDVVSCLVSYYRAMTQNDCNAQCPGWATCPLNGDEHGCSTSCDNTRCNNYCQGLNYVSGQCGGRPGFGGNDCLCISRDGTATCAAR